MSLWCGSCREEIFGNFVILYRMELVDGKPRFPTDDKEYVPPNSALCDSCWGWIPTVDHATDFTAAVAGDGQHVYAVAAADSSRSACGSKTWSGIMTSKTYIYLKESTVHRHVPLAVPIIMDMDNFLRARGLS